MADVESRTPLDRIRPLLLRGYRLAVIVAAVLLIRYHHQTLRIQGDRPITVAEVQAVLPGAASLTADLSDKLGLHVYNEAGDEIGYALRTAPISDDVVGYSGRTDSLVVLDAAGKIVGVRIRASDDTVEHVRDVKADRYHMTRWDGLSWSEAATMDFDEAGVEGVSGATYTSMAMAHGIRQRLAHSLDAAHAPPPLRLTWSDAGVALVIVIATAMMFTHLRGRRYLRRLFQVVLIGYVGFTTGDLLAQSLLMGWAKSGVAWRLAPGLTLLAVAAFVVPWSTRRPLYCASICPHGAAQELIGRFVPWRWHIPHRVERALRWLPPLLIVLVVVVAMLGLPFDLAGVEPFDAYLIATAGWATIGVAIGGLVFAAFVPMGYCKYGCPTGALLEYVRSHGKADRFGRRDVAAGLIVGLIALLAWRYDAVHLMVTG